MSNSQQSTFFKATRPDGTDFYTGRVELPIDLEDELTEILESVQGIDPDVDPETGEIKE